MFVMLFVCLWCVLKESQNCRCNVSWNDIQYIQTVGLQLCLRYIWAKLLNHASYSQLILSQQDIFDIFGYIWIQFDIFWFNLIYLGQIAQLCSVILWVTFVSARYTWSCCLCDRFIQFSYIWQKKHISEWLGDINWRDWDFCEIFCKWESFSSQVTEETEEKVENVLQDLFWKLVELRVGYFSF